MLRNVPCSSVRTRLRGNTTSAAAATAPSTAHLHAPPAWRAPGARWRKVKCLGEEEARVMKYLRIDGNTVLDDREARIAEFNRPGSGERWHARAGSMGGLSKHGQLSSVPRSRLTARWACCRASHVPRL